jgi:hypothetical protein
MVYQAFGQLNCQIKQGENQQYDRHQHHLIALGGSSDVRTVRSILPI